MSLTKISYRYSVISSHNFSSFSFASKRLRRWVSFVRVAKEAQAAHQLRRRTSRGCPPLAYSLASSMTCSIMPKKMDWNTSYHGQLMVGHSEWTNQMNSQRFCPSSLDLPSTVPLFGNYICGHMKKSGRVLTEVPWSILFSSEGVARYCKVWVGIASRISHSKSWRM